MFEIVPIIFVLLFSIIAHERAHGLVALWHGDPTAQEAGRFTWNPLKHIDPFGTVILPVVLMLLRYLGSPFLPIGYAKPVPINYSRLRNPKRDILFVGLAGPVTNILIATAAAAFFHLLAVSPAEIRILLAHTVQINLLLAFFNLMPIPPLDGSRVVFSLLPGSLAHQYAKLEPLGMILVIVLLNFGLFHFIIDLTMISAKALGVETPF